MTGDFTEIEDTNQEPSHSGLKGEEEIGESSSMIPKEAEIVIMGGGVMGSCTATLP
jgi:hypothetical protein